MSTVTALETKEYAGTKQLVMRTRLSENDVIGADVNLAGETIAAMAAAEYEVTITPRHFSRGSQYFAATRAYVSYPKTALPPAPPYGSQRGDGSEEDAAWRKHNRLELKVMRALLAAHTDLLVGLTDMDRDTKFSFSKYAGCTCPCSPGFKADATFHFAGQNVDVWIGPAS